MSANVIHDQEDEPASDSEEGMTRRELKRKARREEMLHAAMSIVVNEGVSALTIARLARELDAAVGALYRYFESKQALITALQRQAID
ncbi:MAG: TetR family transcriptional regulator, partial [Myxococcota bacterium]